MPLLLLSSTTRRDFCALAINVSAWAKLLILFAIGVAGVVSYDYGLSDAHPIIIAAILDLSPFWAALVALIISRKAIPVSPLIFFSCLSVAFAGAMIVTWSQTDNRGGDSILHGSWFYAVPLPCGPNPIRTRRICRPSLSCCWAPSLQQRPVASCIKSP